MLKNYIKTAFKVFLRRKFFTFVSLFGISFTLMVLMVVTATLEYTIAPYPPEVNADRTLVVSGVGLVKDLPGGDITGIGSSVGGELVDSYIRKLKVPEKIALYSRREAVIFYRDDDKIDLELMYVDANYWQVLEFAFIEGRPFTEQEDREGSRVAVISESTRMKLFGYSSPLGLELPTLSGNYLAIGVVADAPRFREAAFADLWVPIGSRREWVAELVGDLQVLLLARSPEDFPQIKAEFNTMLAQVDLSKVPPFERIESTAETLLDTRLFSEYRHPGEQDTILAQLRWLSTMLGAALLFMSIPALSLINLNVSRILERASEIGVRKAFGASSRTLVGQFVVENVLLTSIGGMFGFVLAYGLMAFFAWVGFNWGGWPEYTEIPLNYRVFFWGVGFILLFGLLSGLYPAWRMSKLHPALALRGGRA